MIYGDQFLPPVRTEAQLGDLLQQPISSKELIFEGFPHCSNASSSPEGAGHHLSSCFCSRSRRESSWPRCWRVRLWRGVLRSGGGATLQLGTSWYCPPPRLSPQKLKMLETPERAPVGRKEERRVWNSLSVRAGWRRC